MERDFLTKHSLNHASNSRWKAGFGSGGGRAAGEPGGGAALRLGHVPGLWASPEAGSVIGGRNLKFKLEVFFYIKNWRWWKTRNHVL